MRRVVRFIFSNQLAFRIGLVFFLTVVIMVSFKSLTDSLSPILSYSISLASGLVFAFGLDRLINSYISLTQKRLTLRLTIENGKNNYQEIEQHLQTLLQLNKILASTYDEKDLIFAVLDLLQKASGAVGASFVPIDELGQPLPGLVTGNLTETESQTWSGVLTTSAVKDRCVTCVNHFASPDSYCPLLKIPLKEQVKVECLPVQRDERILGMLNLYLPIQLALLPDDRIFMQSLLDEIAMAVDALHLRNQEVSTLRQLQMLRSSLLDLETSLDNLLFQAQTAFDADFAVLIVQTPNETKPRLMLRQNYTDQIPDSRLESILTDVLSCGEPYSFYPEVSLLTNNPPPFSIIAAPLKMADRPVVGVLLVGSDCYQAFNGGQLATLQMVASQAALLVEHNHLMVDLEYKAVVKERTRLAREIHDGIAQLLAFLKLQTGQMQTFVSQGQYGRLEQALKANYQALSEAYLATRQTIDDLRLTPKDGLRQWMEQIAVDFQTATGLAVNLTIIQDIRSLPNEVQLQLIRITQEALSNIRKHARANQVQISAREWKNDFILEIQDDGMGFSPEDVPGESQYGLRGMRERTELIGADFQIISQPHKGTTIRVLMPIPMEEPQ
jgi:two-component system nitrate/nitrite sensor histidine kinase NarX